MKKIFQFLPVLLCVSCSTPVEKSSCFQFLPAPQAAPPTVTTIRRSIHNSDADLAVESLLPAFGYACEVGANDGQEASNTIRFENKGWLVLCIEPNPLLEKTGRACRRLWRSVACGSIRTNMDFVAVGGFPYVSYSGFHTSPGEPFANSGTHFAVGVVPLNDLLDESGFNRLDLLSVDVEGHEMDVLNGLDFQRWAPEIVIVEEYPSPITEISNKMVSAGYKFIERKKFDSIYQRIKP